MALEEWVTAYGQGAPRQLREPAQDSDGQDPGIIRRRRREREAGANGSGGSK